MPDFARHRERSAMSTRKRRLVRHQRIWRATMKCCASTFAYTLTGPFSGNASRRDLDAGPAVPVPENDTCGPTTPTQHEQRLAIEPLVSRHRRAERASFTEPRTNGMVAQADTGRGLSAPSIDACGGSAHSRSMQRRTCHLWRTQPPTTSWPRGSAVSDGDLRTSPSCRLDAVSTFKEKMGQRAILPG